MTWGGMAGQGFQGLKLLAWNADRNILSEQHSEGDEK